MNPKFLNFFLTLIFVELSFILNRENLGILLLPLSLLYIGGLAFSWYTKENQKSWTKNIINSGGIGVSIWIIYSLINSSYLYEEVLSIFIKGISFFIILLSLNAWRLKFLNLIEILSFQLFLFSFLFIPQEKDFSFLMLFYLLIGLLILRLKSLILSKEEKIKAVDKVAWSIILVFVLSFLLAKLVIAKFPYRETSEFEFPSLETRISEKDDEEYYSLQEELIQKFTGEKVEDIEDKSSNIYLLSLLSKDSSYVQEVLQAELGLLSYLRIEGPGLEKGELEKMTFLLKEFIKKKVLREIARIAGDITEISKKENFSLWKRIHMLINVNRIIHSNNLISIKNLEINLKEIVRYSLREEKAKNNLLTLIEKLKHWKLLQIFNRKLDFLKRIINLARIDDNLKNRLLLLLKDIEDMPPPSQIGRLENNLKNIGKHKDAQRGIGKKIIKEMKDLIELYSELTPLLPKKPERELLKREYGKKKVLIKIELLPSFMEIVVGEEERLKAIGNFADGSKRDITSWAGWEIFPKEAARVDGGRVSALSEGEVSIRANFLGKESNPSRIIIKKPILKSIIVVLGKSRIKMGESINIEARGYYTDFLYKDLTPWVKWKVSNPGVVKIDKDRMEGIMWGETKISCQYQGMNSQTLKINVYPSFSFIAGKISSIFLTFLALLFILFYILRRIKVFRLKRLIYADTRIFIIELYKNMKKILKIFKMPYKNLPLLEYAKNIERRMSIEDGSFLKFTCKFTEASYSTHILLPEDGIKALNNYNRLLKIFIKKTDFASLFLKCILILFNRLPFFIPLKRGNKCGV